MKKEKEQKAQKYCGIVTSPTGAEFKLPALGTLNGVIGNEVYYVNLCHGILFFYLFLFYSYIYIQSPF